VDSRELLLDVGANTDCKPEYLLQFAIMGAAHARLVLGVEHPRVGIVSTGEEEGKGSTLSKEAYALIKESDLNFVGNIDGKDIPLGLADVLVADGFTGNVVLKTSEGVAQLLLTVMKQEIKRSALAKAGALLVKGALKEMGRRMDYTEYGGAPLLGVAGVAIVAHGRSNARAIKNAIRLAQRSVENNLIAAIQEAIASSSVDS
jgi:glycerol-3-phosphate acyltransferase PlsX